MMPLLATKLYLPAPRAKIVLRERLIERLNQALQPPGFGRKLSLISAPAGFGKTTLVRAWIAGCGCPAAWLSLDEGDNDPARFLTYLIAALQTLHPHLGTGLIGALQAPQPPAPEAILTALLNEIAALSGSFVLVLDDYHVIDAPVVDQALNFLLEYLPPQMHLVIASREDPDLPLARLRARDQLTELRAADLRFTPTEAAGFLNQVMGLQLSPDDIAALETRTEGWIAGLQLAALALQGMAAAPGQPDTAEFIKSFTGSHRFVLDYLLEEVLQQQPADVQNFLLQTAILDRLCGPLCDAVMYGDAAPPPGASGQAMLAYIEQANLFLVPLDNERRWYRYHHLFAELLRQSPPPPTPPNPPLKGGARGGLGPGPGLAHLRASEWYEAHGLEIEAFQHAAAANDVDRAARLVEGGGMPLLFRGAVMPVLNWLAGLPAAELDARPALWVLYASALLFVSQLAGIEDRLQAAEAALEGAEPDDRTRDLIGHIASIRATVGVTQHDADTILAQSRRALEYVHPHNLPVRTATTWTLGYAYQLQGERAAALQAYSEAIAVSQTIGHFIINIMATIGLGNVQQLQNQLHLAAQTYRQVLPLMGEPPMPAACAVHLGLGRIAYEWNDLPAAQTHAQLSLHLAQQIQYTDRYASSLVFQARLELAQSDTTAAAAYLAQAAEFVRRHKFMYCMPEVAAVQVRVLLRQGNLAAAAQLAQAHDLPLSQARVLLAQGEPAAALAVLEPWALQTVVKDWQDEQLQVLLLQAVVLHIWGEKDYALRALAEALALAAPGGFVRSFVDEGPPMAQLLAEAAAQGIMPEYVTRLLAAFDAPAQAAAQPPEQSLIQPLSPRELEILRLIAQGLSNHEISARLFLALSTVKGHNRIIFDKLHVQRRTEAVARGRALGLL